MANKTSKADDLAYEMARYMMAGLPIPDKLMEGLMAEVCEEEKAKHSANDTKRSDKANSY